jgi:hypothetical protein
VIRVVRGKISSNLESLGYDTIHQVISILPLEFIKGAM